MGFELFDAKRARGYDPKISIRSNGQIYFNVGAIKRYNLSNYKYAQLFYDKDERQIGIKLTNDESVEGRLNLVGRKDESAWISSKNFFNFFQIELPKEKNIRPKIKYEQDMIILDYPGRNINTERRN